MKWRRPPRRSWMYFIAGVICLQTAYMTFIGEQPVLWRNEHQQVVGVYDLTVAFRIISWSTLAVGLFLLANAVRACFVKKRDVQSEGNIFKAARWLFKTGRRWVVFNLMLISLSIWTGYAGMNATTLQQMNPDAIFGIAILFVMPIFVIGTLYLAKSNSFRRPSWNRFPLNWDDPLQAAFITTWCSFGLFVGSLFRIRHSGILGFWTVALWGSIFVGLLIGQALAYRIYRDRITGATSS